MVHVRYPSLWAPGQDSITMVCAQWWAVEKRCATQGWLCVYVPSPQTLPMAKGIEPLDGSWGLWALWAPWHTSQAFPSQGITWGVTFSFYLLGQGIQTGFCQVCNNENKQTKKKSNFHCSRIQCFRIPYEMWCVTSKYIDACISTEMDLTWIGIYQSRMALGYSFFIPLTRMAYGFISYVLW